MDKKIKSLARAISTVIKNCQKESEQFEDSKEMVNHTLKEIKNFLKECNINAEVDFCEVNNLVIGDLKKMLRTNIRNRDKLINSGNRYFLVDTGERVCIGDTILRHEQCGEKDCTKRIRITEENINSLIEDGAISKKEKGEKQLPMGLSYYIKKIAKKFNCKYNDVIRFFASIEIYYPNVPAQILLKEVALTLDRRYKNNIKECEEVYCISFITGEIDKICSKDIKNFRTIAAFRTKEDAEIAKKILGVALSDIYLSDKEYDEKFRGKSSKE